MPYLKNEGDLTRLDADSYTKTRYLMARFDVQFRPDMQHAYERKLSEAGLPIQSYVDVAAELGDNHDRRLADLLDNAKERGANAVSEQQNVQIALMKQREPLIEKARRHAQILLEVSVHAEDVTQMKGIFDPNILGYGVAFDEPGPSASGHRPCKYNPRNNS